MASSASPRRRAIGKQDEIADALRRRIVDGAYPRGRRIPPHQDLAHEFGVSGYTVQRALKRLSEEGFVSGRRRRGTVVSERPPHLTRYALALPAAPDGGRKWSRFYSALCREAARIEAHTAFRVPRYFLPDWGTRSDGYRALAEDARRHLLAGIIFVQSPSVLRETPLMRQPGLPRVAFQLGTLCPGLDSQIGPDYDLFLRRAMEDLARQGCGRVGVLSGQSDPVALRARVEAEAAHHGLETRPAWIQYLHPRMTAWASHLVPLLLDRPEAERPDGLILGDDNLVEAATLAMLETGPRAAGGVRVVAFANYASLQPAAVPVRWLGIDNRALMRRAFDLIRRLRRGETVPREGRIKPLFEEELAEEAGLLPPALPETAEPRAETERTETA